MQWSCSLRDVKRFAKLCTWFMKSYFVDKKEYNISIEELKLKSIILSLACCFHNRLPNQDLKKTYREYMLKIYN